jgi:hypothetical protein
MRINDNPDYKIFRDHITDSPPGYKSVQQGMQADDQSETDASFTTSNNGDETGWCFWKENTRNLGAYAQIFPVIVQSGNTLRPLAGQGLTADTSFNQKTLVSAAVTDDHTKVRNLGNDMPSVGEFGLVTQCVEQDSHEQVFVPLATTPTTKYAKIRWDYDTIEGDTSEGELVTYNASSDTWSDTNQIVWVDLKAARGVKFETAGDDTIFEMRFWRSNVSRGSDTRDLYIPTQCIFDTGKRITHFQTIEKDMLTNLLVGNFLSEDNLSTPWTDPLTAQITTSIGLSNSPNRMQARFDTEWAISGVEPYQFMEMDRLDRGFPFYFRPIRPVLDSNTEQIYRSAIEINSVSIAAYRKV